MITREDLKVMIEVENLLQSLLPSLDDDNTEFNVKNHELWTKYWNIVDKLNEYQFEIYQEIYKDMRGGNQ